MVCERPTHIIRDERGRLHSESGLALAWPDGWGLAMWHGVRVPEDIVVHPESVTVERIEGESNAEVRRAMVSIFGLGRYVQDAKFEVLDADKDALGFPRRLLRKADLMLVELTNSTPEPDGTRKIYHLKVHPDLRPMTREAGRTHLGDPQKHTALNAVASTYGMRGEDYALQAET